MMMHQYELDTRFLYVLIYVNVYVYGNDCVQIWNGDGDYDDSNWFQQKQLKSR